MENAIKTGAELMRARVGDNYETRDMIDIRARKGFYRDMMNRVVSRRKHDAFSEQEFDLDSLQIAGRRLKKMSDTLDRLVRMEDRRRLALYIHFLT